MSLKDGYQNVERQEYSKKAQDIKYLNEADAVFRAAVGFLRARYVACIPYVLSMHQLKGFRFLSYGSVGLENIHS